MKRTILPLLVLASISSFAQAVLIEDEIMIAPEVVEAAPAEAPEHIKYGFPNPPKGKNIKYIRVVDAKSWTIYNQEQPIEGAKVEIFDAVYSDASIQNPQLAKMKKVFEGKANAKGFVAFDVPEDDPNRMKVEYYLRTSKGKRSSYNPDGFLIYGILFTESNGQGSKFKIGDYKLFDWNSDGKLGDEDKYKEGVLSYLNPQMHYDILYLY